MWGRVLIVLVLVGCPKAGPSPEELELQAAIDAHDAAWRDRDRVGLDATAAVLDALPPGIKARPEVAWRRARVDVARGLVAGKLRRARRWYASAREIAMACVLASPGATRGLLQADLPEVLPRLAADRAPCAAWAGYAWARWYTTWEPDAGTVDLPTIDALLARGRKTDDPAGREAATWGGHLVAVHRPHEGSGPNLRAWDAFSLYARQPDDDAWVKWADVIRLVPSPIGDVPDRPPATPEERAAAAWLAEQG